MIHYEMRDDTLWDDSYMATELQSIAELQSYRATKLQSYRATELQSYRATELHSYRA